MKTDQLSRRGFVGVAGLAAAAGSATVALATPSTTMSGLWADVQTLDAQLATHRAAITAATEAGGISGWMRLGGEANRIAEERYAKLMAILRASPESRQDLAIMAKVTLDDDVRHGAVGWAGEQLARGTIALTLSA